MISQEKRKNIITAVNKITYGLYIITSVDKDGKPNGQCCNSLMQITSAPVRVVAGINKQNYTYELIKESNEFAINFLNKVQIEYITLFGLKSGRTVDKFSGKKYHNYSIKSPVLDDADAYLECRVIPELTADAGTHAIFVADVIDGKLVREFEPVTYDYYKMQRIKKEKNNAGI